MFRLVDGPTSANSLFVELMTKKQSSPIANPIISSTKVPQHKEQFPHKEAIIVVNLEWVTLVHDPYSRCI